MDAAGAKSTKIGPRKVNGIALAKQAQPSVSWKLMHEERRIKEERNDSDICKTKHRVLPWALGRWLVLQQADRSPSSGGVRVYCSAVRPEHNGRGRRLSESNDGPGHEPRYPRWPLLRRNRDYRRRN